MFPSATYVPEVGTMETKDQESIVSVVLRDFLEIIKVHKISMRAVNIVLQVDFLPKDAILLKTVPVFPSRAIHAKLGGGVVKPK
jgi:hypothetical protein